MINTGKEWDFMDIPNKRNPHGYFPKISYWIKYWESHMEDLNEDGMKRAEEKLMYFFGKQLELNKENEK